MRKYPILELILLFIGAALSLMSKFGLIFALPLMVWFFNKHNEEKNAERERKKEKGFLGEEYDPHTGRWIKLYSKDEGDSRL